MNLTQCRKLEPSDKFRRPSLNSHDNGWRVYTVREVHSDSTGTLALVVRDQHGYETRLGLRPHEWKQVTREFMKIALDTLLE